VVGRTTHGGGIVRPGRTAVHPGGAANFCRFRVALRLPAIFAIFCLYNAHVPGHSSIPNTLPFHSIFNLVLD